MPLEGLVSFQLCQGPSTFPYSVPQVCSGGSCVYKELCLTQNHPVQEVTVVKGAGSVTSRSAQSTSVLWDVLYSLRGSLPRGSEGRKCVCSGASILPIF